MRDERPPQGARGPFAPEGVRERHEAAVRRWSSAYSDRLEELAECNRGLARLVSVRALRSWTDFEHDSYLRLRGTRTDLNARVSLAQRAFERARVRLRDFGQLR